MITVLSSIRIFRYLATTFNSSGCPRLSRAIANHNGGVGLAAIPLHQPLTPQERSDCDFFIDRVKADLECRSRAEVLRSIISQIKALPPAPGLRHAHYDRSMHTLINAGALHQAHDLFQRGIREGLTPSTSVTTHFLRAWGTSPFPDRKILHTITEAVMLHEVRWDDGLRTTFLSNLVEAGRYDLLTQTMAEIKNLAGPEWKPTSGMCTIMIRGLCLAKRPEAALRWLQTYRDLNKNSSNPKDFRPYVALLRGLAHPSSPHTDPTPCYTIFAQMIEDDVPLHISVFNALLAIEVRTLALGRAFALYRVMERRYPHIQPDAATFATMFKAHNIWHPGLRRIPRSARRLFRRMMDLHMQRTHRRPSKPSPHLSASTLNVAIRAFVQSRDYAAAIVGLRTFGVCKLKPTNQTEWNVTSMILRRMKKDLGAGQDPSYGRWIDRMRGNIAKAENVNQETEEIKELLLRMKRGSRRAAQVLQPHELQEGERAIDNLLASATNARRRSNWSASQPRPVTDQVNVKRLLLLTQQAMSARLSLQSTHRAEIEVKFIRHMAQANQQMLPARQNAKSDGSGVR